MPQAVDPFIPITRNSAAPHARSLRGAGSTQPAKLRQPVALHHKPLTTIRPRHNHTTAAATPTSPPTQPTLPVQKAASAEPLPRRPARPFQSAIPPKRSWLDRHPRTFRVLQILQYPAVLLGSLAAGIVAQSVIVGQIILLIYAIIALIFRIESRTTFLMAFFLFCGLVILLIFRSNNAIATNFAVYAFILLIVGVLSLIRELKERYV